MSQKLIRMEYESDHSVAGPHGRHFPVIGPVVVQNPIRLPSIMSYAYAEFLNIPDQGERDRFRGNRGQSGNRGRGIGVVE